MSSGEPVAEAWTIARLLRWAAEDFQKRGLASPRLDAELLLAQVLGVDRVRLLLEASRPLSDAELGRYRELIKRRRAAEPIAYILGEREFYALPIRVDRRVLIPRPDTETLVEVALARSEPSSMFGRALDLCTGSGCVALAFAEKRPTWQVIASEISEQAAELAWENALRLGLTRNLRVLVGDLFEPVPREQRFTLVMANPPYIPSAEIGELSADIREYEPRLALDGGPDGQGVLRRIIEQAPHWLEPGGVLALEVMYDQAGRVAELFEAANFREIERKRDYGGNERVVSGLL
ncbi:MAG TPA: peptide chain release factor N(5)-glutamine methyltransferase [Polyangiaceae bacterium]|jgi:release factor glutamine methyltransferase|nr:peptide chain release factor N(5)-glutamine methyltransferase [Polyangiaceae bacterium]